MADRVTGCWRVRSSLCTKTSDDPLDLHAPAVHFIFEFGCPNEECEGLTV